MDSFKGIDLQVNGWDGVDFSSADLTREDVSQVADLLEKKGTGTFLPTVVTTSPEGYQHILPILGAACEEDIRLPGIHLEGPFISQLDGAVGAHPKMYVREPSIDRFKRLQDQANGQIRLVTLAPEVVGALGLIEYFAENKVIASVGHTLADSRQIEDACRAGATLATHLGNGIPNEMDRTANPIWAILASSLTVMLITDGFHTPPDFIKVAYAAKGAGKIILTSDAAPVAGQPPGEYEIFGTRVWLTEEGHVRNLNAPTLAGSGVDLARCARVCKEVLGVDDSELEQMCFGNAVALLNT